MDETAGWFFDAVDWFVSLPAEFQAVLGICAFCALVWGIVKVDEMVGR